MRVRIERRVGVVEGCSGASPGCTERRMLVLRVWSVASYRRVHVEIGDKKCNEDGIYAQRRIDMGERGWRGIGPSSRQFIRSCFLALRVETASICHVMALAEGPISGIQVEGPMKAPRTPPINR